ncbi:MAG: lysine biosynthesis protein LysW [Candidatus Pacebacteria bacterium]|nr:lysine biosynthesis protein LysW [Candidatus Paceibacterota bacterium]
MTNCQECGCEIPVDEKTIKIGDIIACPACGAEHEIISTEPIELELIEEEK